MMNTAEPMVVIDDLARSFKRSDGETFFAVNGVSFEIRKGEIFSLLGPNGAGKTTLISMISGLLTPTRGDATIGGFSITQQPMDARRLLGVVPQEIALYLQLSARQNLEFFGKMYGLRGAALRQRVDEVLAFNDLTDRQKDNVETFSGGMKRRVNIGIGLLNQPQLLYMDEPTVGIDPQNRRRVLDTVMRLREERGTTVLYTSHLMEEVQEISDRVAIVDHGRIIAIGTVGKLIQMIGEEDRLILSLGAQALPDGFVDDLRGRVPGITRADYATRERTGEGAVSAVEGLLTVYAQRGRKALPDIVQLANAAGLDILSVEVREPDLEAVFLQMTGRALRD
jgi:ABC-2 type transport system ATP-binding protein